MAKKTTPPPSMTFAGMEDHVSAQEQAAAVHQAEELTAKMLEPIGSVDARAGRMERESPLFYGQVHATLFEGWDHADARPLDLAPHHD